MQAIAGLPGSRALLPHGLRHACASRLNNAGAALTDIKDFLGHSSIMTTMIYLHGGDDQQRRIASLTALPGSVATPEAASDPPAPVPRSERSPLRLVSFESETDRRPGA